MNAKTQQYFKEFGENQVEFIKTVEKQTQQMKEVSKKNSEILKLTDNLKEAFTGRFTLHGRKKT